MCLQLTRNNIILQDLKHSINNCISHVIGSADRNIPTSPTHGGK